MSAIDTDESLRRKKFEAALTKAIMEEDDVEVTPPHTREDGSVGFEVTVSRQMRRRMLEDLRSDPEMCSHCLWPIRPGWVVCPHCGQKVAAPKDSEPSSA